MSPEPEQHGIRIQGFNAELIADETGIDDTPLSYSLKITEKIGFVVLPVSHIVSTSFVPPFLLTNGKYIITSKDGMCHILPVKRHLAVEAVSLRNEVDRLAGINAFERETFRSPYSYGLSMDTVMASAIVVPFGALQVVGGTIISAYIGGILLIAGIPLILMGAAMIFFTLRNAKHSADSECPICRKIIKVNTNAKFQYCSKCKQKIRIEKEYLEVR